MIFAACSKLEFKELERFTNGQRSSAGGMRCSYLSTEKRIPRGPPCGKSSQAPELRRSADFIGERCGLARMGCVG